MATNVAFDQMMAELRAEYLASIPQKIVDIQTHLTAKDFAQLREDFHKLKGTGRTYGIPEISELSEVVEKICLTANEKAEPVYQAKVSALIPQALAILGQVRTSRLTEKEYTVTSLPAFQEMKLLLK